MSHEIPDSTFQFFIKTVKNFFVDNYNVPVYMYELWCIW